MTWEPWKTEAAMVADFAAWVARQGDGGRNFNRNRVEEPWTVYAETAGWDLLLVRADGFQIGVEAKLSLNAKVLCQVLEHERYADSGPDCHAVLVPEPKTVGGLATIARRLGIVVITASAPAENLYGKTEMSPRFRPELPQRADYMGWREDWPERCPDRRCALPDYVPDVTGGHPSPVALTKWKIAAIKAAIIMETRGFITRADFKKLGIDSSRWTQGWLQSNGEGGWVPRSTMPNFKAQHPVNYEQIKADAEKWMPAPTPTQPSLLSEASA